VAITHRLAADRASARAFDVARADARTSNATARADASRALRRIAAIPLTILAADHPTRGRVLAAQQAIVAARLRAHVAHVVTIRSAAVATHGAAAVHAEAGEVTVIAVAIEVTLVAAGALAAPTCPAATTGIASNQAEERAAQQRAHNQRAKH